MDKINPEIAAGVITKGAAQIAKAGAAGKTENLFETDKTNNSGKLSGTSKNAPAISEEAAKDYATDLYNAMKGFGANGKTVDDILLNGSLNSYDIVSVIDQYASVSGHHFLAKDLASNFMGKHEDRLLQKVLDACMEVYADDSPENMHLNWRAKEA